MNIKPPNEYAKLSQQARRIATEVKPDPNHPCANLLHEAVVYLNMAASKIQAVAEFNAEKEKANATGSH